MSSYQQEWTDAGGRVRTRLVRNAVLISAYLEDGNTISLTESVLMENAAMIEKVNHTKVNDTELEKEGLFFHCIVGPLVGIQSQHIMKTASKAFSQAYEQLIGHKPSNANALSGGSGAGFILGPSDTRNIIQSWSQCRRKDMSLGSVQTLIGVAEAKLSDVESEFIQMDAEQAGHSGLSETTELISEARVYLVKAIECLRGKSQKGSGDGA